MSPRRSPLLFLALIALPPACAHSGSYDPSLEPGGEPLRQTANAWILDSERLDLNPGWTVLQAITGYLPAVQVSGGSSAGDCPEVIIRGRDSVVGSSNPAVYVDGSRVGDTCILASLLAQQVRRVEVYPLGVTPRAGYLTSPHGLVLIFMKRAG